MANIFRPGHLAVITGAASGIGLALTTKCVRYGMRVIAADWNETALAEMPARVQAELGDAATAAAITPFPMDVAKQADWARLRKVVQEEDKGGGQEEKNRGVQLLALNAGIAGASAWTDAAAFERLLGVNLLGVVHGIAALLENVRAGAKPSSAIVITGSKQGITNPPGRSPAYNASKAAVRSLAEHLAYDLDREAEEGGPHVSVHLLVPGWTYTNIGAAAGAAPRAPADKPAGAWWPAQVVDYLEAAMRKGGPASFYVLCPDGEVSEADDARRVLWAAGDVAERRAPLSRWRPAYAEEAKAFLSR